MIRKFKYKTQHSDNKSNFYFGLSKYIEKNDIYERTRLLSLMTR